MLFSISQGIGHHFKCCVDTLIIKDISLDFGTGLNSVCTSQADPLKSFSKNNVSEQSLYSYNVEGHFSIIT